ncbi:MAG: hypothetical protein HC905_25265 [Bacteroidales bacterium]|nr:hypothetical protein [Bacteroidales bacterium]
MSKIKKLYYLITLLILMLGLSVRAQTSGNKNCNQLLKGYITDEQEYLIKTEDISRFDIIFIRDSHTELHYAPWMKKLNLNLH